jgi:hypothetical protein
MDHYNNVQMFLIWIHLVRRLFLTIMILILNQSGQIQVIISLRIYRIKFYLYIDLFVDGNDFSYEAIQKGRNKYYQKQTADQITSQVTETILLLTTALNTHINIGQNLTMNTPSVFMSLETLSVQSLSDKQIQLVGGAEIRIPSNLNISYNTTLSLRVCFLFCSY